MKYTTTAAAILLVFALLYFWTLSIRVKICKNNKKLNLNKKEETYSTKFLVIVPAHNEELNIKKTIKSVKNTIYPKELRDIVVIADRCIDHTVQIAKNENIVVYENLENKTKSKGGLLKNFFKEYEKLIAKYDYICIIDADTIVDETFFMAADQAFKDGHKVVQGKVNVLNRKNNIVSCFFLIYQSIINVCLYEFQSSFHRSVLLSGKGVLISPAIFKSVRWDEHALIEDVDLSFKILLKGFNIHYCNRLIVSLFQPYTFHDMWSQQRRWISGQRQMIKKYAGLIKDNSLKGGARMFIHEGLVVIFILPVVLLAVLNLQQILLILPFYYIIVMLIIIPIVRIDKSMKRLDGKGLMLFPFLLVYWYLICVISFCKPVNEWKELQYKSHSIYK